MQDIVVGREDVVAVDVLERVHVVDGHGARVAQEVPDEEDYLGDLHRLEANHLVEYHREQHLQDEEGRHCVAEVEDHVLEAGLARNYQGLVRAHHIEGHDGRTQPHHARVPSQRKYSSLALDVGAVVDQAGHCPILGIGCGVRDVVGPNCKADVLVEVHGGEGADEGREGEDNFGRVGVQDPFDLDQGEGYVADVDAGGLGVEAPP